MTTELTKGELGELYGVTTRTIHNWEADGCPHRAEKNRKFYPLKEVVAWHEARKVEEALAKIDTSAMDAAKLRKLEADAESKELDVEVKRGDLVPTDEVDGLVREALETVNAVLRHAPSRFAPRLAQLASISIKDARTILENLVEMVRASVRDRGEEVAGG